MRTCRRLGIRTVAVYSEADRDAPHVADADEAVLVGPPAAKDSYLERRGHPRRRRQHGRAGGAPGVRLPQREAGFARAVADAGAVFVGPPPEVLEAFGDKMKARHVALAAGTAPVPGTDEPIPIDTEEGLADARRVAERVGYPVVVKAVGGGGGIGMQVVTEPRAAGTRPQELLGPRQGGVRRRARLPRALRRPAAPHRGAGLLRHARRRLRARRARVLRAAAAPEDRRGDAVAGGVLRRARRARRGGRALLDAGAARGEARGVRGRRARASSSPTRSGQLFFLEVNARLQVEHPVTEMVTGLDLVELQLRVAAGESAAGPVGASLREGHAVEARVYAEDPSKGFIPKPGPSTSSCGRAGRGRRRRRGSASSRACAPATR